MAAPSTPDPSPKEIAAMCAEFQRKWTPTQEKAHRLARVVDGKLTTGGVDREWEPPVVVTSEISSD